MRLGTGSLSQTNDRGRAALARQSWSSCALDCVLWFQQRSQRLPSAGRSPRRSCLHPQSPLEPRGRPLPLLLRSTTLTYTTGSCEDSLRQQPCTQPLVAAVSTTRAARSGIVSRRSCAALKPCKRHDGRGPRQSGACHRHADICQAYVDQGIAEALYGSNLG
jgi:hypothetical protein